MTKTPTFEQCVADGPVCAECDRPFGADAEYLPGYPETPSSPEEAPALACPSCGSITWRFPDGTETSNPDLIQPDPLAP